MDSALVLFHRLSMQSIVLYDVVHMTMDLKKVVKIMIIGRTVLNRLLGLGF
jgi:hypothetical protein